MATTVRIEIDSELLAGLRERHPGKPDREPVEDLARIELGFGALGDIRARNRCDTRRPTTCRGASGVRGATPAQFATLRSDVS